MALGRPLKGGSRRTPITVHAPYKIIEIVDDYVSGIAEEKGISYTRSDFYNDAVIAMLDSLGIPVPEEDRRTQNVPGVSLRNASTDNMNNTDKKSGVKQAEESSDQPATKEFE